MITDLTPEQEALISVVREKWRKIALDNSPTDKKKAEVAINNLYQSANLDNPEIIWFDSPVDACLWIAKQSDNDIRFSPIEWSLPCDIDRFVERGVHYQIKSQLGDGFYEYFTYLAYTVFPSICEDYLSDIEYSYAQYVIDFSLIDYYDDAIFADYYDLANIEHSGTKRNWEEIIKNIGFGLCLTFKDLVIVTTKPSIIKLDSNLRLHADGEVALQYEQSSIITEEEFEIYAYHGSLIPEKYGFIKYADWQPQWLAKEKDSNLKWILAKEIGYHNLVKEFPVSEVRTWNNSGDNLFYKCTLLRVKSDPYGIFFLKVIFFDRDKTYFCLLPEDIYSVRQAEIWVKATIYSKLNLSYVCHNFIC